jgi:ATP-binding cassette subfamily C protein
MLNNVSFTVQPGQRVALVSASGSGKSTWPDWCGLYEPWQGDPRRHATVAAPRQVLSRALALVDQDIVLFAGTVRENLTLWDATVPGAQLTRACKDALIHEVVLGRRGL